MSKKTQTTETAAAVAALCAGVLNEAAAAIHGLPAQQQEWILDRLLEVLTRTRTQLNAGKDWDALALTHYF